MNATDTAADRSGRPLERAPRDRVVAGVCRGLADHLGLDPVIVRLAFVLVTLAAGIGLAAYIAFWLLMPKGPGRAPRRDLSQATVYGMLGLGLGLLLWVTGFVQVAFWPVLAAGIGAAVLWQQAAPDRRQRWVESTAGSFRRAWLRSVLGVLLVAAGLGWFIFTRTGDAQAKQILLVSVVVVSGVAVIVAPWLLRLWRDLDVERRERIRSQERAELAAHVHDSVLHTLTLIQRNSHDPREVQRLARAQERDLRGWLYQPKADAEQDLAAAIRQTAAEVEDFHGVPIEVVCVGDCPLTERLGAAVQAAREAMVNAAKYAEAPSVSVYAEVEGDTATVFVRDRGAGFDLEAVPDDRMGVRESIIGRMERNDGKATIRTSPGKGTEVRLEMRSH